MLADRFEVRAVCDQVAHRAEQAAAEFHAAAVDGFRALAHREDIDAVLILSLQWYGALPILAACERGQGGLLCGRHGPRRRAKPRRIKQRVEEAGIAFMAEFPRRHAPATLRLKELIATELGPPRLLFCHRAPWPTRRANHAPHRRPRAPATRDLVELVDWCRYVVGREARPGHRRDAQAGNGRGAGRLPDDEPGLLRPHGIPAIGPIAQISCGRYIPARLAGGDHLSALGRRCKFPASGASPSSTCPRRWSGSTRPAGTRSRWKASVRWASSC